MIHYNYKGDTSGMNVSYFQTRGREVVGFCTKGNDGHEYELLHSIQYNDQAASVVARKLNEAL